MFNAIGKILTGSSSSGGDPINADRAEPPPNNSFPTYECGHVIPLRTKQNPAAAEGCRECGWRELFDRVETVRRAKRIRVEEIRRALDMSRHILGELDTEEKGDELNDTDEQVSRFMDAQREEWVKQLFGLQEVAADKIALLFDEWKVKWGEPTEMEVRRWEDWREEAAALSKEQDESCPSD